MKTTGIEISYGSTRITLTGGDTRKAYDLALLFAARRDNRPIEVRDATGALVHYVRPA